MESVDAGAKVPVDNIAAADVNAHNDDVGAKEHEEPTQEKSNTSVNATPDKKRRSGGRKGRCDVDIMEEAKAAYGELDSSEGRRLRKRPDPPKVETPPPAKRRSGGPGRKKAVKEDDDSKEGEDQTATVAHGTPKKKEKKGETDSRDAAEAEVDDVKSKTEDTSEQKESCNEAGVEEAVAQRDAVIETPDNEVAPTSQTECDVKSNGEGTVDVGSTQ